MGSAPTGWLRTERLVQAVFGITLACLIVIGVVSYRSVAGLHQDVTRVAHSLEVIAAAHSLRATVTDAETAQRGFVITGQEDYLAQYAQALAEVDGELRRLSALTINDAAQRRQLARLSPLVTQRIALMDQTIAHRRSRGFGAAQAAIMGGSGKELQDRIRGLVGVMEGIERGLLLTPTIRAAAASARSRPVIVGGTVLALLVASLGLFGTSRDFVGRAAELARANQAMRASEVQLRTIMENLAEGLVVSDLKGQLLHFNRAALDAHGYTSLDEVRRHLNEFADTFELATLDGTVLPVAGWPLARVLGGETLKDVELNIRHLHAGWRRTFSYGGTLIHDDAGQPLAAVVTMNDIGESKRAEQEIRQLNEELEQRVIERTGQLLAANNELEAFSYSVSHDLRSPLRTIDGFSQAVLEDYGALLPEEGQRLLRTVRQGAQRMGALIDDLLTFSKLSQLPLNKVPVDMNRLVRETLGDLRREWNGRHIELSIGELPACQGDPVLLAQVWQNLLSNAVKYTRQCDRAAITVRCTVEHGHHVYAVKDNGIGFDMRYAHKLFAVFQRLHRAEDFEGTGVGLAIVQRIVTRHGGRVWADATVNHGATFFLTLDGEVAA